MQAEAHPLIVGAGPVGLAAALFLARQGQAARIVEMCEKPLEESRALAVNPRTLDLLEGTGVTRRMLDLGLRVRHVRMHRHGQVVGGLPLDGLHAKYPFMLALSQAVTERLLTRVLQAAGGRIERGIKLVECRADADVVEAVLEPTSGGPRETVRCPWLLAADGAHSVVREQLGIDFVGTSFEEPWHLVDAPLKTTLSEQEAHVFLLEDGEFVFVLRVVDDMLRGRHAAPVWRVLGNRPAPLAHLVQAEQAGEPLWTSTFHISHRINSEMARGPVYFAGDAAHIHSPMGARGMNLGIEDAWVFARLVQLKSLHAYDELRRPVDRRVVRRVELLSRIVAGESSTDRLLRLVLPAATRAPLLKPRLMATMAGLDHELPAVAQVPSSTGIRGHL
jgi:2-polyprenyl-6-methoxyphenol hydroxylase-like FAD-dependent oxidoreductase